MNIAICDQDYYTYQQLYLYIKKYFEENSSFIQSYTIDYYPSIDELLDSQQNYDILFIDIYMNQESQLAKIRTFPPALIKCFVFITNNKDYAVDAFRFGAIHYLIKPLIKEEVKESLRRCILILEKHTINYLNISTTNQPLYIPCNQINYIHANNRRIYVHTSSKVYTTYLTLDKLNQQLDDKQFMRVQRSYIVNMHYITDLYAGYIILENDLEIKLSRINQAKLKEQYQQYQLKYKNKANY